VNRTDRLYALVDELRRVSPRTRSAAWLARRFEVSARTIERDLDALRESGVPVWAEPGRTGGYGLDRDRTLPPLALTAEEALAVTVALRSLEGSPFGEAATGAARKVLAGLPADVRDAEERLAARLLQVGPAFPPSAHGGTIVAAVAQRRVLQIRYVDARGAATEREVEPLSLLRGPAGWYLVAWCRLRRAVRGFLLERIAEVALTEEIAPPRDVDLDAEIDRIAARPLQE
jgi:predicted DNA-binding transcriptional regulator YafY